MDIGHSPYASDLGSDPIALMQNWGTTHPHTLSPSCAQCPYRNYCASGCPRLEGPYCHIYQALIPFLLRLESKRLIRESSHATLN
jgi:hypothetical protein